MNKEEILEKLAKSSNIKEDLLDIIDNSEYDIFEGVVNENKELFNEIKRLYSTELLELFSDTKRELEELDNLKETIKKR
jgi:hypothetical protein